jgi:metal-responsive CopG/Arc/MetJ family transcriptional regulator
MDALIEEGGYGGRTDVVRASLRAFFHTLASAKMEARESRTATITLVYDEGSRKILELRHAHAKLIRAALHAHSAENCVEVLVVAGTSRAIRIFADELRACRETYLVNVVYTDALELE